MSKYPPIIRLIAALLVITFLAQDIVFADPDLGRTPPYTLQIPSRYGYPTPEIVLSDTLKYVLLLTKDRVVGELNLRLTPNIREGSRLVIDFSSKYRGEGHDGGWIVPCSSGGARYEAVIRDDRTFIIRPPGAEDIEPFANHEPAQETSVPAPRLRGRPVIPLKADSIGQNASQGVKKPSLKKFVLSHIGKFKGKQRSVYMALFGIVIGIEGTVGFGKYAATLSLAGMAISGHPVIGAIATAFLFMLGGICRSIAILIYRHRYPDVHIPWSVLVLAPGGAGAIYTMLVLIFPTYKFREILMLRNIEHKVNTSIYYSGFRKALSHDGLAALRENTFEIAEDIYNYQREHFKRYDPATRSYDPKYRVFFRIRSAKWGKSAARDTYYQLMNEKKRVLFVDTREQISRVRARLKNKIGKDVRKRVYFYDVEKFLMDMDDLKHGRIAALPEKTYVRHMFKDARVNADPPGTDSVCLAMTGFPWRWVRPDGGLDWARMKAYIKSVFSYTLYDHRYIFILLFALSCAPLASADPVSAVTPGEMGIGAAMAAGLVMLIIAGRYLINLYGKKSEEKTRRIYEEWLKKKGGAGAGPDNIPVDFGEAGMGNQETAQDLRRSAPRGSVQELTGFISDNMRMPDGEKAGSAAAFMHGWIAGLDYCVSEVRLGIRDSGAALTAAESRLISGAVHDFLSGLLSADDFAGYPELERFLRDFFGKLKRINIKIVLTNEEKMALKRKKANDAVSAAARSLENDFAMLGLKPGATWEEVDKKWKKLCHQLHPDKTKGDKALENRLKIVNGAHDNLKQARKRNPEIFKKPKDTSVYMGMNLFIRPRPDGGIDWQATFGNRLSNFKEWLEDKWTNFIEWFSWRIPSPYTTRQIRRIRRMGHRKDADALTDLIRAAQDEMHTDARITALKELERNYGEHSANMFIWALEHDPDYSVRNFSAVALARLKDKRAIAPLTKAFRRSNEQIETRYAILDAIITLSGDRAASLISRMVRSEVDYALIEILFSILPPLLGLKAADYFMDVVENVEDTYVKVYALKELGKLRDSKALPVICGSLDHADTRVKIAAVNAISDIGDPVAGTELVKRLNKYDDSQVIRAFFKAIERLDVKDPLLAGTLSAIIKGPYDHELRMSAIRLLTNVNAPGLEDVLIETLDDSNHVIVMEAIRTLGLMKSVRAVDPLIYLLASNKSGRSVNSMRLLDKMTEGSVLTDTGLRMTSAENDIFDAVALSLWRIGTPKAQVYANLIRGHLTVINAEDENVLQFLIEALKYHPIIRHRAANAMRGADSIRARLYHSLYHRAFEWIYMAGSNLLDNFDDEIRQALRSGPEVAMSAARVAGRLKMTALVPAMNDAIKRENNAAARLALIEGLAAIGTPETVDGLVEGLKYAGIDNYIKIRDIAIESLRRLGDRVRKARLFVSLYDETNIDIPDRFKGGVNMAGLDPEYYNAFPVETANIYRKIDEAFKKTHEWIISEGTDIIPELLEALDSERWINWHAARHLMALKEKRAAVPIIRMMLKISADSGTYRWTWKPSMSPKFITFLGELEFTPEEIREIEAIKPPLWIMVLLYKNNAASFSLLPGFSRFMHVLSSELETHPQNTWEGLITQIEESTKTYLAGKNVRKDERQDDSYKRIAGLLELVHDNLQLCLTSLTASGLTLTRIAPLIKTLPFNNPLTRIIRMFGEQSSVVGGFRSVTASVLESGHFDEVFKLILEIAERKQRAAPQEVEGMFEILNSYGNGQVVNWTDRDWASFADDIHAYYDASFKIITPLFFQYFRAHRNDEPALSVLRTDIDRELKQMAWGNFYGLTDEFRSRYNIGTVDEIALIARFLQITNFAGRDYESSYKAVKASLDSRGIKTWHDDIPAPLRELFTSRGTRTMVIYQRSSDSDEEELKRLQDTLSGYASAEEPKAVFPDILHISDRNKPEIKKLLARLAIPKDDMGYFSEIPNGGAEEREWLSRWHTVIADTLANDYRNMIELKVRDSVEASSLSIEGLEELLSSYGVRWFDIAGKKRLMANDDEARGYIEKGEFDKLEEYFFAKWLPKIRFAESADIGLFEKWVDKSLGRYAKSNNAEDKASGIRRALTNARSRYAGDVMEALRLRKRQLSQMLIGSAITLFNEDLDSIRRHLTNYKDVTIPSDERLYIGFFDDLLHLAGEFMMTGVCTYADRSRQVDDRTNHFGTIALKDSGGRVFGFSQVQILKVPVKGVPDRSAKQWRVLALTGINLSERGLPVDRRKAVLLILKAAKELAKAAGLQGVVIPDNPGINSNQNHVHQIISELYSSEHLTQKSLTETVVLSRSPAYSYRDVLMVDTLPEVDCEPVHKENFIKAKNKEAVLVEKKHLPVHESLGAIIYKDELTDEAAKNLQWWVNTILGTFPPEAVREMRVNLAAKDTPFNITFVPDLAESSVVKAGEELDLYIGKDIIYAPSKVNTVRLVMMLAEAVASRLLPDYDGLKGLSATNENAYFKLEVLKALVAYRYYLPIYHATMSIDTDRWNEKTRAEQEKLAAGYVRDLDRYTRGWNGIFQWRVFLNLMDGADPRFMISNYMHLINRRGVLDDEYADSAISKVAAVNTANMPSLARLREVLKEFVMHGSAWIKIGDKTEMVERFGSFDSSDNLTQLRDLLMTTRNINEFYTTLREVILMMLPLGEAQIEEEMRRAFDAYLFDSPERENSIKQLLKDIVTRYIGAKDYEAFFEHMTAARGFKEIPYMEVFSEGYKLQTGVDPEEAYGDMRYVLGDSGEYDLMKDDEVISTERDCVTRLFPMPQKEEPADDEGGLSGGTYLAMGLFPWSIVRPDGGINWAKIREFFAPDRGAPAGGSMSPGVTSASSPQISLRDYELKPILDSVDRIYDIHAPNTMTLKNLKAAMERIPPISKLVLKLHYGVSLMVPPKERQGNRVYTYKMIADVMGSSPDEIRRIKEEALFTLRREMRFVCKAGAEDDDFDVRLFEYLYKNPKSILRGKLYAIFRAAEIRRTADRAAMSSGPDYNVMAEELFRFAKDEIRFALDEWKTSPGDTLLKGYGAAANKAKVLVRALGIMGIRAEYVLVRIRPFESFWRLLTSHDLLLGPQVERFLKRKEMNHVMVRVHMPDGETIDIDPSFDAELESILRKSGVEDGPQIIREDRTYPELFSFIYNTGLYLGKGNEAFLDDCNRVILKLRRYNAAEEAVANDAITRKAPDNVIYLAMTGFPWRYTRPDGRLDWGKAKADIKSVLFYALSIMRFALNSVLPVPDYELPEYGDSAYGQALNELTVRYGMEPVTERDTYIKKASGMIMAERLKRKKDNRICVVAIDGNSGTFKSTSAEVIAQNIRDSGVKVVVINRDLFIRDRRERYRLFDAEVDKQGYSFDDDVMSLRIEKFEHEVLAALESFNNSNDEKLTFNIRDLFNKYGGGLLTEKIENMTVDRDTIVIVEGNYLLKPEWTSYFDVRILMLARPSVGVVRRTGRDSRSNIMRRVARNFWRVNTPSFINYMKNILILPDMIAVTDSWPDESMKRREVSRYPRVREVKVGSTGQVMISASSAGNGEEKIEWLLAKVDRALAENKEYAPEIVKQVIFLKDAVDRPLCEEYMKTHYGRDPPATTYLCQAPADGARFAVEVLAVSGVRTQKLTKDISVVSHDGLRWAYVGGAEPDESASNTYERGLSVLWKLKDVLKQNKFQLKDVVRFWNYVGYITAKDSNGRQEYQQFNDARGKVFKPEGQEPVRFGKGRTETGAAKGIFYPAATGIGMDSNSLAMECIAVSGSRDDVRVQPLENPWQVDAHRYADKNAAVLEKGASDTKKTSPMFSRGMAVILRKIGRKIIYVSGTASIERAISLNIGDVRAQTGLSIKNMSRVLRQGGGRLKDITQLRVYIKNPSDYESVKSIVERSFPKNPPTTYIIADVCRDNLLVELEAVAHCRYYAIQRIANDIYGPVREFISFFRTWREEMRVWGAFAPYMRNHKSRHETWHMDGFALERDGIRIEADPKENPISLQRLIPAVFERYSIDLLSRYDNVAVNLPSGSEDLYIVDEVKARRLRAAIWHTFQNALKYSKSRYSPIAITISVDLSGSLTVEIKDEGIGIPPDEVKSVMDPELRYRATNAVRHTMGTGMSGAGLGLNTAQRIVREGLGGILRIDSKLNQGTIVTITVPAMISKSKPSSGGGAYLSMGAFPWRYVRPDGGLDWAKVGSDLKSIKDFVFLSAIYSYTLSALRYPLNAIWLHGPSAKRLFSILEAHQNADREVPVARSLGLDTRPIENGLLNARYVGHDMAIRKIVNPAHRHKTAVYGCSGADISNLLLSTDADEAYFVDQTAVRFGKLEAILDQYWDYLDGEGWNFLNYNDSSHLIEYTRYKYRCGYYYSRGFGMSSIEFKVLMELKMMGVEKFRPDGSRNIVLKRNDDGSITMTFQWQYHGSAPRDYTITFIRADITKPDIYPKILRSALVRGIDIYYQRAAFKVPEYYKDFLGLLAGHVKDGGYLITDDHIAPSGYVNPDDVLSHGKRYRYTKENGMVSPELARWERLAAKFAAANRNLKAGFESYGYGWLVRVRRKSPVSIPRTIKAAPLMANSFFTQGHGGSAAGKTGPAKPEIDGRRRLISDLIPDCWVDVFGEKEARLLLDIAMEDDDGKRDSLMWRLLNTLAKRGDVRVITPEETAVIHSLFTEGPVTGPREKDALNVYYGMGQTGKGRGDYKAVSDYLNERYNNGAPKINPLFAEKLFVRNPVNKLRKFIFLFITQRYLGQDHPIYLRFKSLPGNERALLLDSLDGNAGLFDAIFKGVPFGGGLASGSPEPREEAYPPEKITAPEGRFRQMPLMEQLIFKLRSGWGTTNKRVYTDAEIAEAANIDPGTLVSISRAFKAAGITPDRAFLTFLNERTDSTDVYLFEWPRVMPGHPRYRDFLNIGRLELMRVEELFTRKGITISDIRSRPEMLLNPDKYIAAKKAKDRQATRQAHTREAVKKHDAVKLGRADQGAKLTQGLPYDIEPLPPEVMDKVASTENVGQRIAYIRESKGYTRRQVFEKGSVPERTYLDIENTGRLPRPESLFAISAVLEVDPAYVIYGKSFGEIIPTLSSGKRLKLLRYRKGWGTYYLVGCLKKAGYPFTSSDVKTNADMVERWERDVFEPDTKEKRIIIQTVLGHDDIFTSPLGRPHAMEFKSDGDIMQAIRELREELAGPLMVADVAVKAGVNRSTVREVLGRNKEAGRLFYESNKVTRKRQGELAKTKGKEFDMAREIAGSKSPWREKGLPQEVYELLSLSDSWGFRIELIRLARGLSLGEAAERGSLKYSTYKVSEKRPRCGEETLISISRALDVDPILIISGMDLDGAMKAAAPGKRIEYLRLIKGWRYAEFVKELLSEGFGFGSDKERYRISYVAQLERGRIPEGDEARRMIEKVLGYKDIFSSPESAKPEGPDDLSIDARSIQAKMEEPYYNEAYLRHPAYPEDIPLRMDIVDGRLVLVEDDGLEALSGALGLDADILKLALDDALSIRLNLLEGSIPQGSIASLAGRILRVRLCSRSPALMGDDSNNGIIAINLEALRYILIKDSMPNKLGTINILSAGFTHEVLGHEIGRDDETELTEEDSLFLHVIAHNYIRYMNKLLEMITCKDSALAVSLKNKIAPTRRIDHHPLKVPGLSSYHSSSYNAYNLYDSPAIMTEGGMLHCHAVFAYDASTGIGAESHADFTDIDHLPLEAASARVAAGLNDMLENMAARGADPDSVELIVAGVDRYSYTDLSIWNQDVLRTAINSIGHPYIRLPLNGDGVLCDLATGRVIDTGGNSIYRFKSPDHSVETGPAAAGRMPARPANVILRDIADHQELAFNLKEFLASVSLNRKVVLAFDEEIGRGQAGGALSVFGELERIKKETKLLENLVIVKGSVSSLCSRLQEHILKGDAEIFTFALIKNKPETAMRARVNITYIDETRFPSSAYYPLAQIVAITIARYMDEESVRELLEDPARLGGFNVKDVLVDPLNDDVLIFTLLPEAKELETYELMKQYAALKQFLRAA